MLSQSNPPRLLVLPLLLSVLLSIFSLVAAQSSSTSSSVSGSGSLLSGSSSGSSSGSTSGTSTSTTSASSTSSANLPSLSGVSQCVGTCFLTAIAQVNCTNVVPESCYCNSTNYQSSLVSCIQQSNCSTELASAEGLTNQFCALASPSTSISFSVTTLPSSSSSGTSTVSSTSSSGASNSASATSPTGSASGTASSTGSSSSNAASLHTAGLISQTTVFSVGLSIVGVIFGALLVE